MYVKSVVLFCLTHVLSVYNVVLKNAQKASLAQTVLWYVLRTVNPTHVDTQMESAPVRKVGWV